MLQLMIHNQQKNIEVEVQKRKRARSILDFDSKCVHDDEATMIDDYVAPFTTHDKENPIINEGDTFGDEDEFIMTLRTYAIKNEFDTRVEHSEREVQGKVCRCKLRLENFCKETLWWRHIHGAN